MSLIPRVIDASFGGGELSYEDYKNIDRRDTKFFNHLTLMLVTDSRFVPDTITTLSTMEILPKLK